MAKITVERRPFIFMQGMKIGKDLEACKRAGWKVKSKAHTLSFESDGSIKVTLTLFRFVQNPS